MSGLMIDSEDFTAEEKQKLEAAIAPFLDSDCPLTAELSLVDEETIRILNRTFRNKDSVTDVLSFPSMEQIKGKRIYLKEHPQDRTETGGLFLGSVAICVARAKEQADLFGHSYERELFYLAVHGILHCLGYDHETEEEKKEMRATEEAVMSSLSLSR